MALTAEQLALARQIGGLIFGSALHQGLSWDEAQGRQSRVNGRVAQEAPIPALNVDAAVELAKARESEPINFDAGIVYVPGEPQHNAMFADTPENREAFIRQTKAEHDAALDKYLKQNGGKDFGLVPIKNENGETVGFTQDSLERNKRAMRLGLKAEEGLTKWWNDRDPRLPVTPSSSCVSSARIGPNGDIYIRFRNGEKEYQYEGSKDPVEASRILAQLVTSDSIGRNVNSWTGFWGKAHTYLPK